MGVRGLHSFLKSNPDLFAEQMSLTNTNLVIDANNLLCYLFAVLCLDNNSPYYRNDIYGGDFIAYCDAVRNFFKNLEKCAITPILVFDGSVIGKTELNDFVASKEKVVLQRGLEKFNTAKSITEFPSQTDNRLLLPQRLNNVFKIIVNELGIQKIQAPYEADTHIARVANDLNCPVLTNDSDFIIYDLKQGFIMIDFFHFKTPIVDRSGRTFIDCLMFSQAKVAKSLPGFQRENMPLLSVLLGNDYVEPGTFDRVIGAICNQYDGRIMVRNFNHRRIASLLTWMSRRSLQESIDYILSLVHHNYRQRLETCIRMFLRNYRIEAEDDFMFQLEQIYPRNRLLPNATSEQNPINYLRKAMEYDDLSGIALDMIFKNTHYNYSVLDDLSLPTSNLPMFRPYSLALVLLRPHSYGNMTTYRRQIQSESDAFCIYDRDRSDYAKFKVRPMEFLEGFGSLEHLDCYSMILLEPALKRNIIMSTFRFNSDEVDLMKQTFSQIFVEPSVLEATICTLLIKYIGLETKSAPKPQYVNAIVLTHFYYAAINGQLNQKSISDDNYGHFLLRLRPHTIQNNGRTYSDNPLLFRRIVHMINQLHAAYKGFTLINALLGRIFPLVRYDKWFNGVLIYRITKLLRTSEESIADLCKNLPVLLDVCGSIRVQVYSDE